MRNIVIFTVTAVTITILAFNFMPEDVSLAQPQQIPPETGAAFVLDVQAEINKLAGAIEQYQKINQEHLQRTLSQQARMSKSLTFLETRLQSLEAAAVEPTTDAFAEHDAEQVTDETLAETDSEGPENNIVSEADLGHWMDDTLRIEAWDRDTTALNIEQAQESLAKVPGVHLEEMKCADGFCRATFDHENGEQWEIGELYGEPPFANEGFSINEPDGRVVLYFAQPGESMENLRLEARETDEW